MSGPTTRVLTVLELLQTHGQIGGAELAERLGVDRRTIRLDRISSVHLLSDTFQRPPDFDAAEFLSESFLSWGRTHEVSLLLHTDRESAATVFDFHSSCADGFEQRDDGLLLTPRTDSFEWFAWWLAQLPFRFTIVKPEGLKDALREHATQLLACCD